MVINASPHSAQRPRYLGTTRYHSYYYYTICVHPYS